MAPVSSPWLRRKFASLTRPAKRRPFRKINTRFLFLESLEDRTLLSWTLSNVLSAYNSGANLLAQADKAAALANQAFGLNIPLVSDTLTSALRLDQDFQTPFQNPPDVSSEWSQVVSTLQSAGFTIQSPDPTQPFPGITDDHGDLLRVTWSRTWTPTAPPFTASGKTGFPYLDDDPEGGVFGALTAQVPNVTFQVTLGVDLQTVGGQPQPSFYIADSSALSVGRFQASTNPSSPLTGDISIGSLADVSVSATPTLTIDTASLGLTNPHGDHKLRAADFGSTAVIRGNVQGSVVLAVSLSANLPLLDHVDWSGSLSGAINNGWQVNSVNLTPPTADNLLGKVGQKFGSIGGAISVLGGLANTLYNPLPLINKSIADLTGLKDKLPALPTLPNLTPKMSIELPLGHLDVNITPDAIDALIHGRQGVDLISWKTGRTRMQLPGLDFTVPIFSLGVPDIISAEIDATFGVHASIKYDFGFGIDTTGFWFQAGTPDDPTFSLSFDVTAGVQGQVEVLSFPLAKAGGNLGFAITPYVALTAPPWRSNGKVYLDDLQVFGSNPISDFAQALSFGIKGDFIGKVYAAIDLFLFSISWSWDVRIPVFNYFHQPTWPAKPTDVKPGSDPYPRCPDPCGVLTFNGTPNANNVHLKELDRNTNTIQLTWAGHGQAHTYSHVNKVVFNGGGGDDRLTTAPGFMIPIEAHAPSGNVYLQGGDGGCTLTGGSGNDTLVGGKGNNVITGGSGNNIIMSGDDKGSRSILSSTGHGNNQIFGGAGNDTINGGQGNDSIYGGTGDSVIHGGSGVYFIDGGSGNDTIYGDTGSGVIHGGSGNTLIDCSSCSAAMQIFGDAGRDTITGSKFNDTIHAGSGGGNIIHGGGGNDLIYGGTGNDSLYGDTGNCTIYGGTGTESLYGGDGLDLVLNATGTGLVKAQGDGKSSGNNLLIAGPGDDKLYGDTTGHNTLHAGAGRDTLFAGSGGDYLAAGSGVASLFGGPGDDSIELQFNPTGQQPNTVVGGPGNNTLVLKPNAGVGKPGPGTLTAAVPDAASTTITVTDGGAIARANPPNGAGYVLEIDQEQMLVTAVSGNTVTVRRGYNGTTAARHDVNTLVLPDPTLPAASNFKIFLSQVAGTANQYQATLSNLDSGTTLGQVNFTLPPDVANIALEGGPGNNVIQVDPSVTRNMFLYGGPGNNTLYGGSGNDTLVGGPGSSIIYGGRGDSILYGGDLPSQDQQPRLDSSGKITNRSLTAGHNTLVGGPGNDVLFAGPAGDLLIGGSAILQNNYWVLVPGTGRDVLQGGAGNDLLIAGPGSPGAALLAGSGDDTLVGGPGENIMRGGPGSNLLLGGNLLNVMSSGSGRAASTTLVGGSGFNFESAGDGSDVLYDYSVPALWSQAQAKAASQFHVVLPAPIGEQANPVQEYDRLLARENAIYPRYKALQTIVQKPQETGNITRDTNTVTGLVFFQLKGNTTSGSNTITGLADTSRLLVGQTVTGPGIPDDTTVTGINSNVSISLSHNATATATGITLSLSTPLIAGPTVTGLGIPTGTTIDAIASGTSIILSNNATTTATVTLTFTLTPEEQVQLQNLSNELALIALAKLKLLQKGPYGETVLVDYLQGGVGTNQLYGGPHATWMVGDTAAGNAGNKTFYNYNDQDTIQGGHGTNILMFQGDGTFTLQPDAHNVNGIDLTINNAPSLLVGNVGNISGIQILGVQTGDADGDTVTVNFLLNGKLQSLPPGLTGISVQCGNGNNDVINAVNFQNAATLLGGAGYDTIAIGTQLATGSQVDKEKHLIIQGQGNDDIQYLQGKLLIGGRSFTLGITSSLQALEVRGGPGHDTVVTDGSIHDVVLAGPNGEGLKVYGTAGNRTYEIDGRDIQVKAETYQRQSVLAAYLTSLNGLNGELDVRLLSANAQHFLINGQSGDDRITVGPLDSFYFPDLTVTSGGNSLLDARAVTSQSVTLLGGTGMDPNYHCDQPTVLAGGGNDTLIGGSGNDCLVAGTGNSLLVAGKGNATLRGGRGDDTLIGGSGHDSLYGGTGNNVLDPQDGYSYVEGGPGHNRLYYGEHSVLNGGPGTDNRVVLRLYAGQTLEVFQYGFHDLTANRWYTLLPGSRFDAYDVETHSSGSQIRYGTDHIQDLGFFRGQLYLDGRPIYSTTEFPLSIPNANAESLANGPDGNIWFTETAGNKVGRMTPQGGITEWDLPVPDSRPHDIVVGPDGNLWFTEYQKHQIGIITTSGTLTELPHPSGVAAPDGITRVGNDLWFTAYDSDSIGRIVLPNQVTVYPLPRTGRKGPGDITLGRDGNLWFTEEISNKIGRITLAGDVTEFDVLTANSDPAGITAGPDGNIWFTERVTNKVGRITPVGTPAEIKQSIHEFNVPTFGSQPHRITVGPDGNLWFTEEKGKIGRINPFGSDSQIEQTISEFAIPSTWPSGITTGSDGNLWFAELGDSIAHNKIARFILPPAATFRVSVPANITAGTPFTVTVTALDSTGTTAYAYHGTVHFTSSDGQAVLPADYTFTTADRGVHTFTVTLKTTGQPSLQVADTTISTLIGITTAPPVAIPTVNSNPYGMVAGQDGSLWFTERGAYKIGRLDLATRNIQEFPVPHPPDEKDGPIYITSGPPGDPSVYFSKGDAGKIGRVTPDVVVTEWTVSGAKFRQIITGPAPDYDLYVTEDNGYKIYRFNRRTGSLISSTDLKDAAGSKGGPWGITVGPDNYLWFTERFPYPGESSYHIGRINPTNFNDQQYFTLPLEGDSRFPHGGEPTSITKGPDGNLWFTRGQLSENPGPGPTNVIGRITPTGIITEFPLPAGGYFPNGITVGSDGNLWFAYGPGRLGRITPNGVITEFAFAEGVGVPTPGPSGDPSLWYFTGPNSIGRILLGIPVSPAVAAAFRFSLSATSFMAGTPFNVTVKALDAYGNPVPGYRGTIHFTSTDGQGVLPGDYTFTAADNGVHTFSVTLKTAGNQSVTATDTVTNSLHGSATVTVTPAAVASFRLTSSANPVTAGATFNLTLTAVDAYGNLVTGYSGTIHFTSSDNQAVLPADYAFAATDNGSHTFSVTLKTAGSQTVSVRDSVLSLVTGSATLTVRPGVAQSLQLTNILTTVAGISFSMTVTALDAFGNVASGYTGTVHFSSTDGQATLPPDYTFTMTDNGLHTFAGLVLRTAGARTVNVTDQAAGLRQSAGFTVTPAPASKFLVTGFPSPTIAGVAGSFTVTAQDVFGNTDSNYRGTIQLTSSDPQASLPSNYTFTMSDNGVHTFSATLKTAGTQALTATDTQVRGITGMQMGITVAAAPASSLFLNGFPSSTVAGASGAFTVIARDAYSNVAAGYHGTLHFTSTDHQAGLPADYTFTAADSGIHTFNATLRTTGTQAVTGTDTMTSSLTATQAGITVNPAAADHFQVTTSVDASSTVAGSAFDVTLTVQDAYGNTVTGYTGTVTFSSQDPYGASLPADYLFQPGDMGTHTFPGGTTLYTAGTWDVTVSDTGNPNLTGSDNVLVTPAPASQFFITAPAMVTAGMAFDFTVTAVDPYGNTDTNYTGTVVFSTMDPAGTFSPTSYTFQPTDLGTATFPGGATLNTLGTWDVTATDIDSGITGSATVTVTSSGAPGASASGNHTAAVEAALFRATSATPAAGGVRVDANSVRPIPGRWAIDIDSRPRALEPQLAARLPHPHDILWAALDLFFSEDLFR